MDKRTVIHRLLEEGTPILSMEILRKYFNGMNVREIRDWMESNGFDRHIMVELRTTEILIMTPKGVMMQVRTADEGKLGVFGGVLHEEEEPKHGAIREVHEETGLKLTKRDLKYVGYNRHEHTYTNGDKALCHTYRYYVKYAKTPQVTLNYEASGLEFVTTVKSNIIDHQQNFVGEALSGEYDD